MVRTPFSRAYQCASALRLFSGIYLSSLITTLARTASMGRKGRKATDRLASRDAAETLATVLPSPFRPRSCS